MEEKKYTTEEEDVGLKYEDQTDYFGYHLLLDSDQTDCLKSHFIYLYSLFIYDPLN